MSTEHMPLPGGPAADDGGELIDNHDGRLLLEAAKHIEVLERGLMNLARLPVQAHAARLGLLHELLSQCGQGLPAQLQVASALRASAVRTIDGDDVPPPWEVSD